MTFSREPIIAMAIFAVLTFVAITCMGLVLVRAALKTLARWKIYEKAGVPVWKSLIPFYNVYQDFKLCWNAEWGLVYVITSGVLMILGFFGCFTVSTALTVVTGLLCCFLIVLYIIFCVKLSKAFGHGGGWAVGLFFLDTIFMLMIGLGKSQYVLCQCDDNCKCAKEEAGEETSGEATPPQEN